MKDDDFLEYEFYNDFCKDMDKGGRKQRPPKKPSPLVALLLIGASIAGYILFFVELFLGQL